MTARTDTMAPRLARQIQHSVWFVLLACLAMGVVQTPGDPSTQLTVALALAVVLVASWSAVLRVQTYVRREDTVRQAAAEAQLRLGACQAAERIHDRVANSLAVTFGYAEFLADDSRLPDDAREQAHKAMEGARRAAAVVAEYRLSVRSASMDGPPSSLPANDERTSTPERG